MSSSYIDSANSEQLCYIPCNFCNIVLVVSVPCSNLLDIVTVRCGHCTNLWSVNMAAAFHSNSWQNHHQYLHHQVGNYTNSPHDQYKIDCGSSSITNNSTHTHEERIVNRQRRFRGSKLIIQISLIGKHLVLLLKIGHTSLTFSLGSGWRLTIKLNLVLVR
ncbi:hypothetical protein KY284_011604 [Solanum tuberosum]|nr:hypothetical protein KY284_011604 [Solanum tuberosum]